MKVNDLFIIEAISLSDEVGNVRKILVNAIKDGLTQIKQRLTPNPDTSQSPTTTVNQIAGLIGNTHVIAQNIKTQLWTAYKDKGLHSIKYATLKNGNASVEIGGRTINVNIQFISNLNRILVQEFAQVAQLTDDPQEVLNKLKDYIPSRQMWSLLVKFSNTFVHEMVHVTQHSRQQHRTFRGLPSEYRSYLTKNKEEFNKAVRELNTRNAQLIYFASPQEIAAFAHNMAIQLVDLATNETPVDEMRSTREVQSAINNLEEIIKTNSSYVVSDTFKAYRVFNQPDNPQFFKVYKRFMKRVYQEVMNYKQKLYDRVDEL